MATLKQATQPLDESKYERINSPAYAAMMPPPNARSLEPGYNPNMRCPVPPSPFTPDSSRQFYRGNSIPQFRIFSPSTLSGNNNSSGGGSVTNVGTTIVQSGGTSTTTTNTTTALQIKSASLSTTVLNPGDFYTGVASLSQSFNLIAISVSKPCRVRLYATVNAQNADLMRDSNTAPAFETTQGLIADVVIDSPPWSWLMTPSPTGTNGDFPRTTNTYYTINNLDTASGVLQASLQYVALVA